MVAAQYDDIGLNAKAAKLLHAMLRGLGLDLVGGGDVGHEAHVDVADVLRAGVFLVLANGLHEGLALDIADRAAKLGDHHIGAGLLLDAAELVLDGVRDVRNHLHGAAQEVAAALAMDERAVDGARGEVGVAGKVLVDEALVVAEVEVALIAIFGHEDLAVLERAHGTRVHVEVRVSLLHGDLVPPALEQAAERRGCDALSERRDDATGHEDVLSHYVVPALPVVGPSPAPRADALYLRAFMVPLALARRDGAREFSQS